MRLVLTRILFNFDLKFSDKIVGGKKEKDMLIFENQVTYALWEREPFPVELKVVR
jgi:hypothetical protein